MHNSDYLTRYFTLKDKIGYYGLISFVVLEKSNESLFIENWLMSCRVLKRGMEEFVLNNIMCLARDNGYSRVVGEYIPTEKNQLVRNHYSKLGFVAEDGLWVIDTGGYREKKTRIRSATEIGSSG